MRRLAKFGLGVVVTLSTIIVASGKAYAFDPQPACQCSYDFEGSGKYGVLYFSEGRWLCVQTPCLIQ
jgi:hypothetical protein